MREPEDNQVIVMKEYYTGGLLCGIFSSVEKATQAITNRANALNGGVKAVDDRDHEIVITCNEELSYNLTIWDIDRSMHN